MTGQELSFRVRTPGPLSAFTERHRGSALALWCDWKREVLEVTGAPEDAVGALREELDGRAHGVEAYTVAGGVHVFLMDCIGLPHDDVCEHVDAAGCVNLPPMRFTRGWELYRVVSFRPDQARQVFERVRAGAREVELVSTRNLSVQGLMDLREAGLGALLQGLTAKQAEALLLAHRHGYYRSPRSATSLDISKAAGVSRSTFDEHLRKAEARVIDNLVPYLELLRANGR